ncbi:hypothetical protein Goshw_009748, partial [Gossypium schwendimanii]|nr:hypothetical protein [Gossypium schwendimanii]
MPRTSASVKRQVYPSILSDKKAVLDIPTCKPKSGSAVLSFSAITAMAGGFSTYNYISESEFSFDPAAKLGLDVAACILTRHVLFLQTGPKVYPEGKMSQIFATLKPGDVLEVKGPIEKLRYSPNMKKHIGMVRADDILLKQKLDILEAGHPNLKVFYTVDNPTKKWKGGTRYTSKDMVTKGLPGPSDDTLIFVCGPPGMMEHICGGKAKDHSQGQ